MLVGDAVERQPSGEKATQRSGVEQRLRDRPAEQPAERHVTQQPERAPAERQGIGPEDLLDLELRPQRGELLGDLVEPGGAGRHRGAVDGARRGAGDDRERRRATAERRDLADPLEHAGLVGTAGAPGGQHESEHGKVPRPLQQPQCQADEARDTAPRRRAETRRCSR